MINCAIFDFDGLMLDSEPLSWEAWKQCLNALGVEIPKELYQTLIGCSHEKTLFAIEQAARVPLPEKTVNEDFWNTLLGLIAEKGRLMPGVTDLLDELQIRGFRLGVASNSQTFYVREALRLAGIGRYFKGAFGSDTVANSKPAPDVYLHTLAHLGGEAKSCLAFEDSPPGVRAALNAGIYCVFVPHYHIENPESFGFAEMHTSLEDVHSKLDVIIQRAADDHARRASLSI